MLLGSLFGIFRQLLQPLCGLQAFPVANLQGLLLQPGLTPGQVMLCASLVQEVGGSKLDLCPRLGLLDHCWRRDNFLVQCCSACCNCCQEGPGVGTSATGCPGLQLGHRARPNAALEEFLVQH